MLCDYCFFFSCYGHDDVVQPYHTKHVIVLLIDGARWSETWGDVTHANIPHQIELLKQGVLLTNFYNNGDTHTCSGHVALSTGIYQTIANDGTQLPAEPGVGQYLLSQNENNSSNAWYITSKDKLAVLANCTDVAYHNLFMPSTDCGVNGLFSGYRDDSTTINHALKVLQQKHPQFMFISLKEPDVSAHTGNWDAYINGIKSTDAYAAQLWNFIQQDEELKNTTSLFITNDHGRHLNNVLNGFIDHGDTCIGCRHIELLALGPDFKKNEVLAAYHEQIDLASTMALLLGVQMPTAQGKVIDELFISR